MLVVLLIKLLSTHVVQEFLYILYDLICTASCMVVLSHNIFCQDVVFPPGYNNEIVCSSMHIKHITHCYDIYLGLRYWNILLSATLSITKLNIYILWVLRVVVSKWINKYYIMEG